MLPMVAKVALWRESRVRQCTYRIPTDTFRGGLWHCLAHRGLQFRASAARLTRERPLRGVTSGRRNRPGPRQAAEDVGDILHAPGTPAPGGQPARVELIGNRLHR